MLYFRQNLFYLHLLQTTNYQRVLEQILTYIHQLNLNEYFLLNQPRFKLHFFKEWAGYMDKKSFHYLLSKKFQFKIFIPGNHIPNFDLVS